ncbi:MAG: class I SAM-dependent methyltransferase, partial [Acidimicrobiales bacterium]
GPVWTRSPGDFARVALPEAECDLLRDLLVGEGARVVIEIGLAYGGSTLAIGEALLAGRSERPRHLVIDAFQHRFHDAGWEAVEAAGLPAITTLLRERSQLALPRLVGEGFVADAAFVDGSHVFHNVFVDLYYLGQLVRPGALVILDDCDYPSVATAVRYFEINCGWLAEQLDRPTRLRAFRVPTSPAERAFDDFLDLRSRRAG